VERAGGDAVSVIVLLIAAGGLVALGFLAGFIWAVGSGQFDDLATPPVRLLVDEPNERPASFIQHAEGFHVD
jgi:cbb3-type cytochrome oxidase maturation protein